MKIGIDLRFLSDDFYSTFAYKLVNKLIHTNKDIEYNIYTKKPDLFNLDGQNFHVHHVDIDCGSLNEQIKLPKIFKRDNNNVMIFFNHFKPLSYKGDYYTIVAWLKDIFFQNFSNYFEKYTYLYLMDKNLKNSQKVICLDENTQDELIERFNLSEEKIEILPGFFIPNTQLVSQDVQIDIRSKFHIENDFFLYSGGDGIEKNLDRFVHVFERLHKKNISYDLVFLGDKIGKNIDLRHAIVESWLKNNIHFIDHVKPSEEFLLYQQAKAVIYPTLYESFPLRLSNAIFTNTPILASNLRNIEKVCENSIDYFSPISSNSLLQKLENFTAPENVNYSKITQTYTLENTINKLNEIIR